MSAKDVFEKLVKERSRAADQDNDAEIKRVNDEITQLAVSFKEDGKQGVNILRELTRSDDEEVSLEAAVWLLPLDEGYAEDCLEVLSESDDPEISMAAWASLREWRSGGLDHVRDAALSN